MSNSKLRAKLLNVLVLCLSCCQSATVETNSPQPTEYDRGIVARNLALALAGENAIDCGSVRLQVTEDSPPLNECVIKAVESTRPFYWFSQRGSDFNASYTWIVGGEDGEVRFVDYQCRQDTCGTSVPRIRPCDSAKIVLLGNEVSLECSNDP